MSTTKLIEDRDLLAFPHKGMFDNPNTWVYHRVSTKIVLPSIPTGFSRCKLALMWDNSEQFAALADSIPASVAGVGFDIEDRDSSSDKDRADPVGSNRRMAAKVHLLDKTFITVPSSRWTDRPPSAFAENADILSIQSQRFEKNPSAFRDYVVKNRLAAQAKQLGILVLAQVSDTTGQGATPAQIIAAIDSLRAPPDPATGKKGKLVKADGLLLFRLRSSILDQLVGTF